MVEEDLGGWSPRRLLVLAERLPEGSELVAEQLGGRHFRDWTTLHSLLAAVHNQLIANTIITGHVDKKHHKDFEYIDGPPDPKKVKKKKRRSTGDLFRALGGTTRSELPAELRGA